MDGASSSSHQSPPLSTPARPRHPTIQTPNHPRHTHDEPQPTPQPLQAYSMMPSGFGYPGMPVPPKSGPGSIAGIVYASVYSGVPVFEAMIRGISVMRRTSDSWVNATQILKVAGISKSARTKILDKEVIPGEHEKVQGGYGKYQGTWIPLQRGRDLAAQYGVAHYLAPVFDSVPNAVSVSPMPGRQASPARRPMVSPNPAASPFTHNQLQPSPLGQPQHPYTTPASPSAQGHLLPGPPMLGLPPHPAMYAYTQGAPGMLYYQNQPPPTWSLKRVRQDEVDYEPSSPSLAPSADINGHPQMEPSVYVDSYGQPYQTSPQLELGPSYAMGPPPKRVKTGSVLESPITASIAPPVDELEGLVNGMDDDEEGEERSAEPSLPASMRLANKPHRPRAAAKDGNRTRTRLLSLFQNTDHVDVSTVLGLNDGQVDGEAESSSPVQAPASSFELDLVIDGQGHTALHWACALAKTSIISQLVEAGADIHRGNYAGETPLIRSVLTTNHADGESFSNLLINHLAPSIRTLDLAYRSVLHHIALIAGVKGRAASARHYMAAVLEFVAKEQQTAKGMIDGSAESDEAPLSLKTLLDVRDVHGDTALSVAARVGNKGLVNMLLDAGADKVKSNNLGLRPVDFGVEVEALAVTPAEIATDTLKSSAVPARHSRDVVKNLALMISQLNDTHTEEMLEKQTALNAVEANVRAATRKLSARRQEVQQVQVELAEAEHLDLQLVNLEQALSRGNEDWVGRDAYDRSAGPAFKPVPLVQGVEVPPGSGDPPLPESGDVVALRRMKLWQDRCAKVLAERMVALDGESAAKAAQYRKLIALCAKVPLDQVEVMLDDLTEAVESDGQAVDLPRISTFLTRMKGNEEAA